MLTASRLLTRVYRSFTYAEIAAMADAQKTLPETVQLAQNVNRSGMAQGIQQVASVATALLSGFQWHHHAIRHGLSLSQQQSMHRGPGMSML